MEALEFSEDQSNAWDAFCDGAINGTFLHTRRFLSYHGSRFKDASFIVKNNGRLSGVCPAASDPDDASVVVSHPGITYGGLVHDGQLRGQKMFEALKLLASTWRDAGYRTLRYKALPFIYSLSPAQDDSYALFRLGAQRYRCDLSCAIDLGHPLPRSERRKRSLKKAGDKLLLSTDPIHMPSLWSVLNDNLRREHAARPTHSLDELQLLARRFPDQIRNIVALADGQVEAGVVLFRTPRVHHAQYIASTEKGYDLSALDAIFDRAIGAAQEERVRYFDFGTSNEEGGRVLNEGLYQFKSGFGGAGVAHEYFELTL